MLHYFRRLGFAPVFIPGCSKRFQFRWCKPADVAEQLFRQLLVDWDPALTDIRLLAHCRQTLDRLQGNLICVSTFSASNRFLVVVYILA